MTKLFKTLTAKIAASYVALTFAVTVVLVVVLSIALSGSLQRGVDTFLDEMVDKIIEGDPPNQDEIQEEQEEMSDGSLGKNFYIRLTSAQGEVLLAAGLANENPPEIPPLADEVSIGERVKRTVTLADGRRIRVMTRRYSDGSTFQMGAELIHDTELRDRVLKLGLSGVIIMTILAASIGWWLARRAMRGVLDVTLTARNIVEGSLDIRVPVDQSVHEVAELAAAFNTMLERIEDLVGDVRRVSADMVHDLRSPLTRVRAQAELVLRGDGNLESYQQLASRTVEEIVAIEQLIDMTLEIISLESGVKDLCIVSTPLAPLIREALELYCETIQARRFEVSTALDDDVEVLAEPSAVRRIVANVLDNAVKFSPDGGSLVVGLSTLDDHAVLVVEDSGPGIPVSERQRVFDRFYRSDASRGTVGSGLGLSYVLAATQAMGGRVELGESPLGGAKVRLFLPRSTIGSQ